MVVLDLLVFADRLGASNIEVIASVLVSPTASYDPFNLLEEEFGVEVIVSVAFGYLSWNGEGSVAVVLGAVVNIPWKKRSFPTWLG